MEQNFMKVKSPFKLVITMSLPMVLSMLVNALYNIVDSYFIAKISEDAMTALSLVFPLQNLVMSVAVGFGIGINSAVSFYLGAQKPKSANKVASQGTVLNTVHGIILMLLCLAVMPSFLKLFTDDEQTISYALRYSNIVFLFSVVITVEVSFEKIFQSVGKMAVSMLSMLGGCIVNIILDPILIFGIGFIPSMGIEGAALATGIGQVFTLLIYLIIYFMKPLPVKLSLKGQFRGKKYFKRLYSVGIPATLNMALPSLLITALNGILAQYSQMYVLVLGIYYKLQTFIYLTSNGIVQGIRPIVGYNYGAKEYKRVKQIHNIALLMCSIVMLIGMLICLFGADKLMSIFTSSSQTIESGAAALTIICWGFVPSSVSVITCGSLEGLGKGMPSLVISLIRYIAIIPIAYLMSRIMGAAGVWHSFWITEIISCMLSYLLYRRSVYIEKRK
ncbi:MAG: MATE family efflux transporter [Eubacterium sp.]|nr:MATE family efflux transporter [Eubacterium sp.]MDE6155937.1 MATE family efflux transporter [Eubacterium sp.]